MQIQKQAVRLSLKIEFSSKEFETVVNMSEDSYEYKVFVDWCFPFEVKNDFIVNSMIDSKNRQALINKVYNAARDGCVFSSLIETKPEEFVFLMEKIFPQLNDFPFWFCKYSLTH